MRGRTGTGSSAPAAFRKRNMRQCITEIQGRIEFTTEFKAISAKDVRQRMDQVMADRGEGLVMKAPDSAYVLNGRTNDWIKVCVLGAKVRMILAIIHIGFKVKPEYMVCDFAEWCTSV